MAQAYFDDIQALSLYARNYPANCFYFQAEESICRCGKKKESYEVIDRQDSEIIETLVLCPRCAIKPQNNQ